MRDAALFSEQMVSFHISKYVGRIFQLPTHHRIESKWRFAVDRGGTFTDVIGRDPAGTVYTIKLLSSSPDYTDPSTEGIRRILGLSPGTPFPENGIEAVRLGTTVATNALLERHGGKTSLLITEGFRDLLEIGSQMRPDIFALCIRKPPPLYSNVFEVEERIDRDGRIVKGLCADKLDGIVERIKESGVDSVAVLFMHSWKNPAHELLCERILKEKGINNIFLSHRTVNLIKMVSRGQSTVVDAYLGPLLATYIEGIKKVTGSIPLEFMQSSGNLCPPHNFKGRNAILAGPAGGVIAIAGLAEKMGLQGVIGFDMGGTSTDVSRYDGSFEKVYEQTVAGIDLHAEALDINTVASGGGSILWFDGRRLRVGPESAGADPGPACYGFGGPLTVTDANLLTGRIIPEYFPSTFGPERNGPLDKNIAAERFKAITTEISDSTGRSLTPEEVAHGFLRIANEKMAMAIKEISVSRGFDVRKYTLICFGGAGGQHACRIAELLGIEKIVFHPMSGVMSAYGIGLARPARRSVMTVMKTYTEESHDALQPIFDEMERNLLLQGEEASNVTVTREIDLRPKGADTYLTVKYLEYGTTTVHFGEKFKRTFGFQCGNVDLEIVNMRIEVQEGTTFFEASEAEHSNGPVPPPTLQEIVYPGEIRTAPVYTRASIQPGRKITAPAFIIDRYSSMLIDPGFEGEVSEEGVVIVKRVKKNSNLVRTAHTGPDPILIEIISNLFMNIALEMGHILKNTAHSVNIKERLDFSCAVFDANGDLIANAPHIPVHLGSMSDAVKAVLEDHAGRIRPGDIYLTNNPYRGGSHLPDMTVIRPVFTENGVATLFTASRGHHADIGGKTPGSLPPFSRHIEEEGVLLDTMLIVRDGKFMEAEVRKRLSSHAFPARNIVERIADLKAQVAACHKGEGELMEVVRKYGWKTVKRYIGYIRKDAEYAIKTMLHRFLGAEDSFEGAFEDMLDDSTPIRVRVTIESGPAPPGTTVACIDFTGTGLEHRDDNLNAPLSVTRSAVLYVLRLLTETDIPLNGGCLQPIDIIVPRGTILNPSYPSPVGSGNVETSQRIVDVLLGAFGVAAASQGTMNNLLFEVEGETPYYETIAGGSGALYGCNGASGVQVHMTNTRMTDPEILEIRHAGVRVEQFKLRKGSGGSGLYRGGTALSGRYGS